VDPIETPRLRLRRWRWSDAEHLAALNGDPDVMRFIGSGDVLDRAQSDGLLARFEREWDERGFSLWAVEDAAGFVGFCGLTVPTFLPSVLPAVEVGWRLRRSAWGRGYATEAAAAALEWGFERLEAGEIVAIVHPENERSLRVAAKLGMTRRPDRLHPVTGSRLRVLGVGRESTQSDGKR
jgi:RimJ/RimL family protein N-acetyltransferase